MIEYRSGAAGPYQIDAALRLILSAERIAERVGADEYLNIPASFDIETTQTATGAYMYVWQIALGWYPEDYAVLTGRTRDAALAALSALRAAARGALIPLYVHNLSYEHSFFRRLIPSVARDDGTDELFAVSSRRPIRWRTEGIEWRCSEALSHSSLAEVGKHLIKYKVEKAVGDLDYRIPRNSQTELTAAEWRYCIQDVLVVIAYIREKMEEHGDVVQIPMTSTGEVRKDIRAHVLGDEEIRQAMHDGKITLQMYALLKRAYQGGYTHASPYHAGELLHNVGSIDFTSSYPAVCLLKKFPAGAASYVVGDLAVRQAIDKNPRTMLPSAHWVAEITFDGLEWSHALPDCTLSLSKCETSGDVIDLNGRVMIAPGPVTTYCTEIDYEWIMRNYTTRGVRFEAAVVYPYSALLPQKLRERIMYYYRQKTSLKGVQGAEKEYASAKAKVNSIYGCMVTSLIRETFETVGGVWQDAKTPTEAGKARSLANTLRAKDRFLNYVWGVYVTAHARSNLFDGLLHIGADYVYSDTDSIKMLSPETHMDYIRRYNERIRVESIGIYGEAVYYESIAPEDIKGRRHPIGEWDYEGTYDTFKALRAKAYLTQTGPDYTLTLAGCGKRSGTAYFASLPDPWGAFNLSMSLPPEVVDKLIPEYFDDPVEEMIVDAQGHAELMTSASGQILVPVGFDCNITFADAWSHICRVVRDLRT